MPWPAAFARLGVPTRSLAAVPRGLLAVLALAFAAQLAWHSLTPNQGVGVRALPPAPPEAVLRLAALGEPAALARSGTLWLQFFDQQAGHSVPYREMDYTRVRAWLARWLALEPASDYPLLLAVHLYGQVNDPARQRIMLDFVHAAFVERPRQRWRWLAEASIFARHRLDDPQLALRYARELNAYTERGQVPHWAQDLQIILLEDMGEVEAARVLIGGLLANGEITDPQELRFLRRRLETLARQEQGTVRSNEVPPSP